MSHAHLANAAVEAFTVSASNDPLITSGARVKALYVGTGGDLTVSFSGDSADTITFTNVQGGTILPIQVTHVTALASGAANVVALL